MITLIIISIYLTGSILAILTQLLHLKSLSKRFGKNAVPKLSSFWISYLLFDLTSWIGFIITACAQ